LDEQTTGICNQPSRLPTLSGMGMSTAKVWRCFATGEYGKDRMAHSTCG